MKRQEHANWYMKARLLKYKEDITPFVKEGREAGFHKLYTPYEVIHQEGNCLLNSGINLMWALITASDTTNIFNNTNAEIGVGDSSTAANATQTDLQAVTNKLNKGMEASFPTAPPVSQKATFKSSFGAAEANFAWQEWVVREKQTDVCLNRKVESLGTKSTGTWTLEVDITLS